MISSRPFARAIAMAQALAAALSMPFDAQREALAKIAPYESHGKGKGRVTYANGNPYRNGHWGANNPNGKQAMARRRRQIERGIIHVSA